MRGRGELHTGRDHAHELLLACVMRFYSDGRGAIGQCNYAKARAGTIGIELRPWSKSKIVPKLRNEFVGELGPGPLSLSLSASQISKGIRRERSERGEIVIIIERYEERGSERERVDDGGHCPGSSQALTAVPPWLAAAYLNQPLPFTETV